MLKHIYGRGHVRLHPGKLVMYQEVFNLIYNQGNGNKNYSKIPFTLIPLANMKHDITKYRQGCGQGDAHLLLAEM